MKLIDRLTELAFTPSENLPAHSLTMARMSLFDWIVCGLGGRNEPVSSKVRNYIETEYATGVCSVFGGVKTSPVAAALANGTISHALDYDDTHFAHIGHLSVGIFPAAMAVAQETGSSIDEMVAAFLVGAESAVRTGMVLGPDHYERGFHQTATAGAFGATIAAARLYGLSSLQCGAALGLCATRASGLKNQFGTMGKPLNAGYSASNGVECAKLAATGVSSADDGLEGMQGFIETHSAGPCEVQTTGRFLFDDITYKLHACCHGTHAMIEAILKARDTNQFTPEDVAALEVGVHSKWLRVCDNKHPKTGLEVKFSYAWLAGMTVKGLPLADPATFTDELCRDSGLQAFAAKVVVTATDIADTAAQVAISLVDGTKIKEQYDLSDKIDIDVLSSKLRNKAHAVTGSDSHWMEIHDNGGQSAQQFDLAG